MNMLLKIIWGCRYLIKYAPETDKKLIYLSQQYLSTQYLDENGRFGYIDKQRWDSFYNFGYMRIS